MSRYFPIVALHNVSSASRCTEFVTIALGLRYRTIIITNAQGSAAHRGIPLAHKLTYKAKANFMAFETIQDVKELFKPDELVIVAPKPYGKEKLNKSLAKELAEKDYILICGGNDSGLSRRDIDMGRSVQLEVGDVGSIGLATLAMAMFQRIFD